MALLQDSPLRVSQLRAMERRHESSLGIAVDRLRHSEDLHERELQPLQSQADSLRQLLGVTAQTHSRERHSLREQLQDRLDTETHLQQTAVRTAQARLADMQHLLAVERGKAAQLRKELLELRLHNGTETARRQEEERALRAKLERLKVTVIGGVHSEIAAACSAVERAHEEHAHRLSVLQITQQRELSEMQSRLATADSQISHCEEERIALRQDLQHLIESRERDLSTLHSSVRAVRSEAKSQADELGRLGRARDSALERARELSVEAGRLKRQRRSLKTSSEQLRSSSVKLERLVYGRRAT